MTKLNLRIISKADAYLQTMTKTPIKFQNDQLVTVGVDVHTRYLLLGGGGGDGKPNTMSPRFSSKMRGTKR